MHPCLRRGCRHPDSAHVATPELAGPQEVVVWCVVCQRHETRGVRRWFSPRVPQEPVEYTGPLFRTS
jgi:hypothetical protein